MGTMEHIAYPDYNGTSCVAPFYAGLAARIQSAFGFSPGFLNPLFYQLGLSSSSPFNTIMSEQGNKNLIGPNPIR